MRQHVRRLWLGVRVLVGELRSDSVGGMTVGERDLDALLDRLASSKRSDNRPTWRDSGTVCLTAPIDEVVGRRGSTWAVVRREKNGQEELTARLGASSPVGETLLVLAVGLIGSVGLLGMVRSGSSGAWFLAAWSVGWIGILYYRVHEHGVAVDRHLSFIEEQMGQGLGLSWRWSGLRRRVPGH